MAFESPGWANSGGSSTYTAEQTRRAVFSAYARTAANTPGIISGGLLSTADLQLTAPGSGASVNVGTGECIVGGSEGGVQGGYYARNAATVNLAIAANGSGNPRIDTVCVTISDGSYTEPTGGSGNQVAAQVVTGTPTSGATLSNLSGAAALPASSLLLGYVLAPNGFANIITADIANKATVVQIGPVRGAAAMAHATTNQSITTGTLTAITLGSTDIDNRSWFASNVYTPQIAGLYLATGNIAWSTASSGFGSAVITKNGGALNQGVELLSSTGGVSTTASAVISCNGSTDTIGLGGYQNSGSSLNTQAAVGSLYNSTFLTVAFLGVS